MKLYYAPGACSLAVHIALREIKVPFVPVAVDLSTHKTADGADYFSISPRGYVPTLQLDDGSSLTEVAALLQYVAELDPTKSLIGEPGSSRRLAVVQWLSFVSSELHKVFSPWLWSNETAESTRQAVTAKIGARFVELNNLLTGRDYLAGEYSVADAYAFTVINWANFVGIPLAPYPGLKSYLDRVSSRTHVNEALRVEGLVK